MPGGLEEHLRECLKSISVEYFTVHFMNLLI